MNHLDQKNPELASRFADLATRNDAAQLYAELSAMLAESRDAVSAQMDRAVRRTVLTLGALMVLAGATVVLLAWSAS
jgi:hypothetical protein